MSPKALRQPPQRNGLDRGPTRLRTEPLLLPLEMLLYSLAIDDDILRGVEEVLSGCVIRIWFLPAKHGLLCSGQAAPNGRDVPPSRRHQCIGTVVGVEL